MSRKQSRARKRRARKEELRAEVAAARAAGPEALWNLLSRIADTDGLVWDVARVSQLDDDEIAMVMQSAAPHIAVGARGLVEHRRAEAERRGAVG